MKCGYCCTWWTSLKKLHFIKTGLESSPGPVCSCLLSVRFKTEHQTDSCLLLLLRRLHPVSLTDSPMTIPLFLHWNKPSCSGVNERARFELDRRFSIRLRCFISGCVLQVSVRYVWLSSLGYRTPGDLDSLSFALFWRPLNTCHIITGSGKYVHVLTVLISYRKGFKVIYDKCPVQHADYGHDHLSLTHTPVKIMLIIMWLKFTVSAESRCESWIKSRYCEEECLSFVLNALEKQWMCV